MVRQLIVYIRYQADYIFFPVNSSVNQGSSKQFFSTVPVTWSVSNNTSQNTSIDQNGVLTVGEDEHLGNLTITGSLSQKSKSIEVEVTNEVRIDGNNITSYFNVSNGSYYFDWNGSGFNSNNQSKSSSTASTILTAINKMNVSFDYFYGTEASYDKFTLKFGGNTIENNASGGLTNKSYSGVLEAGQTIEFTYSKDGSADRNGDTCGFSNMIIMPSAD